MEDIRRGKCPLCAHDRIVESWPSDWDGGNANRLSATNSVSKWGKVTDHGPMAAYICAQCGYTQWFTASPGEIPIGPEFRTRLVTPAG